jgi:hypothetical protein
MRLATNAICLSASLMAWGHVAVAEDYVYEGTWNTTNRKLDGRMTCVVTDLGEEKWAGRFYGVWQGVAFDYPVTFQGPADKLRGTAVIDGASYNWTGEITTEPPMSFEGKFGGSRYAGYFKLREKKSIATSERTASATELTKVGSTKGR